MENLGLMIYDNDTVVVSSKMVAEKFGKEHKNVLRDIENLMNEIRRLNFEQSSEGGQLNFEHTQMFYKTTYTNEQNKQRYPMYLMNRDGFSLLVMGFTGKEALQWKIKFIDAFNEMERALIDMEEPDSLDFSRPGYITITAKKYHGLKVYKDINKNLVKRLHEKDKRIEQLEKTQMSGWDEMRYSMLKIFHTSVCEAAYSHGSVKYEEVCKINKFMNDVI